MIFSAKLSAVVLLFVLIIYPNDGVNGDCKQKVSRALIDHCARGKRDVSQLDPVSEVNDDSGKTISDLQKRQISPDEASDPSSSPPISDHDQNMRSNSMTAEEFFEMLNASRSAKNMLSGEMEDFATRCCNNDDCSNPPPSLIQCP